MKKIILLIILVLACKTPTIPEDKNITSDDIYAHISFLASDSMEGRKAGSPFEQRSALYVKKCFETYGLEPIGESYYQEFEFAAGTSLGKNNSIILKDRSSNSDFATLSFSASAQVNTSVVFAGYGISAPELNYDDYKDLNVSGKIVMILRYSPDGEKRNGDFAQYAPLRYKAVLARERGAAGVVFVTGPSEDNNGDKLEKGGSLGGKQGVGIPAVHVKRKIINEWLESFNYQSIDQLQEKINGHGHPQTFGFTIDSTIQINTDIDVKLQISRNVIGAIRGTGELKDEWLSLGGHMDH